MLGRAKRYQLTVTKEERGWFVGLHTRADEWATPFPPEQVAYMVQDIEVPFLVADAQQSLVHQHGLEEVVQLEVQALPAIAAMEVHGALVDQERWRQALHIKRARQTELEQTLIDTLGNALFAARLQRY